MDFHPVSEIFPMMEQKEYEELRDSIAQNGQRLPIYTYDCRIIDGRNRWRACKELGLKPNLVQYVGDEAGLVQFVIDLNIKRRHMTESQLALYCPERIAEVERARAADRHAKNGGDKKSARANSPSPIRPSHPTVKRAQARDYIGAMLGISGKKVLHATTVKRDGTDSLVRACYDGKATLEHAYYASRCAPAEQNDAAESGPNAIRALSARGRAMKKKNHSPDKRVLKRQVLAAVRDKIEAHYSVECFRREVAVEIERHMESALDTVEKALHGMNKKVISILNREHRLKKDLAVPHLRLLGLEAEVTPAEVKSAYRKLAKEHHPDKGGDAEDMNTLNGAYKVAMEAVNV